MIDSVRCLGAAALLLALPTAAAAEEVARIGQKARVVTVAEGFDHPWGLAFLPDGRMLVTEREGNLRIVAKDGTKSEPLDGVPPVRAQGQGGLLDVALDPDFARNQLVYLSYAEAGPGGAGTAVARGTLSPGRLRDVEVIFRQQPKVGGSNHWGSRLVFDRQSHLFVTLGDRYAFRDRAQDLSTHIGKFIRINRDGSVPQDNPFVGKPGALPEIWSYGHRNMQGAALHPETGVVWTHEHGARGGDEINAPEPGKNYGWPVITHGIDYSGAKIGIGKEAPGMEQPLHFWVPSIAPSGMMFYTGNAFPDWKGSLFVGALAGEMLVRLTVDGRRVTREERLLRDLGRRIRDVRQGPDGLIYLLTDQSGGSILRIEPL